MNTYEELNRLGEIIGELAELYAKLSAELPQLHFAGAGDAPAKSEVKKIAVTF